MVRRQHVTFATGRIAFAVVLSGLSFFLLRQFYYGHCIFPSDFVSRRWRSARWQASSG